MGGGAIITAGLGGMYSAINNLIAGGRENERAQQNYELNEKAAENADKRTRALYNDLMSPSALLEQYKQAGLSPSLMFGGGGIGGTTPNGAQGEGASGLAPNVYGASPLEMAQTQLVQAQTEKTKEETKTINETREPSIDLMRQDLKKKIEETTNVGLKNAWQELENAITMFDMQYQASTIDEKIRQFLKSGEILNYRARQAKVDAEISEETEQDTIDYLRERAYNIAADTILKTAQADFTNEQKKQLADYLQLHKDELELDKKKLAEQVKQWGIENGLQDEMIDTIFTGIVVNGVVNGVGEILNLLKFAKGLKGGKAPTINSNGKTFKRGGKAINPSRGLDMEHRKGGYDY